MNIEKAYTYVDTGVARAGNRWLERQWSGFLGQTVELRFPRQQSDWTAAPSPEFLLRINGELRGFMDFGMVEWAEECDSFGATLVCTFIAEGMELASRTTLFHYHPGLLRRWTLMNTGDAMLQVQESRLDILDLRRDSLVVEEKNGLGLARTFGHTLLLHPAPPAGPVAEPGMLAITHAQNQSLHPGQRLPLGESRMLFVSADAPRAMERELPQFLQHVAEYREAEEEAIRMRRRETTR